MWQNHAILYPQFHHPRHDSVRIARDRSRVRRWHPEDQRVFRQP